MQILSELETLSPEQRRHYYSRLWFELTIAARAIWSDPEYSDADKLNALKWLNEIQHRTWHAFMDSPGYSPSAFLEKLLGHIQQAEILHGHFLVGHRRAFDFVVKS